MDEFARAGVKGSRNSHNLQFYKKPCFLGRDDTAVSWPDGHNGGMQLSSAELIVTIVSAIVGLLMGFVSGAMPLQPQRMTPVQATAQKVLGFAIVAVVVVLALASMNVAMWTTLIAVALGIAIANVPVIRRAVTTRIAWFAPKPDFRRSKRRRR